MQVPHFSRILFYLMIWFCQKSSFLALTQQIYTGCAGYSLSFDGSHSFVQINAPACNEKNPYDVYEMTYEMWFYLSDWKNTYQIVFGQGGEYGVKILRDVFNKDITVKNINGASTCYLIVKLRCNDVPTKTWYHIALTYNGTHFFLYCNGELLDFNIIDCTGMGPGKYARRFDIGHDSGLPGVQNAFGMFDELRG